jgi:hypothetical protein
MSSDDLLRCEKVSCFFSVSDGLSSMYLKNSLKLFIAGGTDHLATTPLSANANIRLNRSGKVFLQPQGRLNVEFDLGFELVIDECIRGCVNCQLSRWVKCV